MYGQNIFSNFLLTGLSTDETQNESTQCTAQLLLELPISDYKFDSTITSLTMPNGLMFTQHFTSATKFHSFIGIKADGVKFYGGSLVFFEPVSENIAKRIQHYLIGKSSKQLTNAVKLDDTESVLIDISGSECDQKDSVSTDVLSDIYDLESHLSSIKTSDSGISLLDLQNGPNNLFVTKSISLVSNQPLNSSFEQILIGLYQIYEKGKNRNDIKIALYNLLYECKFYPAQSISIMEDFLTEHVFVYFPGI
ncbi:hypothetical protein GJ496_006861 [Pomphorhynchus laevis]|nr:hypothetical protein GJ496_006861 [Pomphorhynchus laevis]